MEWDRCSWVGRRSRQCARKSTPPCSTNWESDSTQSAMPSMRRTPTGRRENSRAARRHYAINDTDQLFTADQYRPLIVAYHNGAAVRLGDVGEVQDSVSDTRNIGLANGKPGVLIIVFRQPGANIIETVDRVRALMPFLQSSISPAIDLTIAMDRTVTVRASVKDIETTLIISVILVILVVFAVLADRAGDDHPQHRGAALAGRNIRRACTCWVTAWTICH